MGKGQVNSAAKGKTVKAPVSPAISAAKAKKTVEAVTVPAAAKGKTAKRKTAEVETVEPKPKSRLEQTRDLDRERQRELHAWAEASGPAIYMSAHLDKVKVSHGDVFGRSCLGSLWAMQELSADKEELELRIARLQESNARQRRKIRRLQRKEGRLRRENAATKERGSMMAGMLKDAWRKLRTSIRR